ncbi:unnamed protein product, partial [Callosobruchus maculatus]
IFKSLGSLLKSLTAIYLGLSSVLANLCDGTSSSSLLLKNTFLMQLLHEKIHIDYYGFMQMNASFLLNNSNQAMSLLIFLFQATNNYFTD